MVSNFLDATHLVSTYGYIGIFVIVLIESGIFFFLPGDSLLFVAGLVAAGGELNALLIITVAITAGYLGNLAGYWIGGRLVVLRGAKIFRPLVSERRLSDAHKFFEKYGKAALVLARFVPGGRTFVPWAAGAAKMDKGVFSRWTAVGAVAWAVVMTLVGYFLGRSFPQIERYLTPIVAGIIIVSVLPAAFGWWRSRRGRRAE